MRIARETVLLGLIGLVDLVYTVWVLRSGLAVEGNPVMAFYAAQGLLVFVAVKALMIVGPLAALEWVRTKRRAYVEQMMRIGIILYLGFYAVGLYRLNHQQDVSPAYRAMVERQASSLMAQ